MTLAAALPSHEANLNVPFLDLRVTDPTERAELLAAAENVLSHGRLVNGPEVHALELQFAARCNQHYAVGVGSGTDALIVALRALSIGPSDEVIIPALSFIATANAVRLVGAEPIFCDIGNDLNIDVQEIEGHITSKTKAIIPVHWAGRICSMGLIRLIAKPRNLFVIEDASQAFGAMHHGSPPGYGSDVACYSMNPMKTLGALGDAGMLVTDNGSLYDKAIMLRYNGIHAKEYCWHLSGNHRLDTIQAAMLMVKLKNVDKLMKDRRNIAFFYDERLKNIVETPIEHNYERHGYYTYTIQCEKRDALKYHLELCGIETKIQHPILMPNQALYLGSRGSWANAERLMQRVLCLPFHEKLTDEQIWYVVNSVTEFYR